MHYRLPTALLLACLLSAGCAQVAEQPPQGTPPEVDFSGFWEKDYRLSDDFNNKFNLFLHDLRRGIAPTTARGSLEGTGFSYSGSASSEAIMGLARLAEEITRMPALEILQQQGRVTVEREGDFALRCAYYQSLSARTENPFGTELCGWNDEQLIFRMELRDGLSILHQLTLGPDGQQLNLTTTVSSASVSSGFTISNYYRRYAPPESDYECTLTLSRRNVCSRREAAQ